MQQESKAGKNKSSTSANNLRNILRDIANTILIGFFSQGTKQTHQAMLSSLVADYNTVISTADISQNVRAKTMLRIKVAKDIFRSKVSQKVVKQSDLQPFVTNIC